MNKKDAVVLLNPGDRCSRMLDYCKKYDFTPIILRVQEGETKEISNDIDQTILTVKKRIKNLVVVNDEQSIKIALKKLEPYNVKAVIPYEETIAYGDKLASILNLNGNDPLTSNTRKNKYELNNLLKMNKIRSIESRLIKKNETVSSILKDFELPLVLKPSFGSSSVNVFVVFNETELQDKLNYFNNINKSQKEILGDIIVQEFISGNEYVANFISYNGKHILTDV
jgi:glutathione synthase/RimK-type ligase-like ATP-grasp enzyme